MKNSCILLFLLFLVFTGCKSDKESAPAKQIKEPKAEKVDESLRLLNNIESAHNSQKFKSEEQVEFNVKFELKDSVFFDGKVTLKTDGSKARFLDSNIDKIIDPKNLKAELDKKLFMILEAYTMGFWFEPQNLKIQSKSDSLDISDYGSTKSNSNYKIYTHPITHIIQKIDFETTISDSPFDSGTLIYDKYITVNRIPVALRWNFEVDQQQIATVEISRISYPDTF